VSTDSSAYEPASESTPPSRHPPSRSCRALRTFLQTLIPALGAGAITDLDYLGGLSIAAGAALISLLQGLAQGLPEAEPGILEDGTDDSDVPGYESSDISDAKDIVSDILGQEYGGHNEPPVIDGIAAAEEIVEALRSEGWTPPSGDTHD
jgi:hypothetical protein